ncbi:hypothetical protein [Streptomyces sp. YIM S03343]
MSLIRDALTCNDDVLSADVIDDGEIGVETTDGRFFISVESFD